MASNFPAALGVIAWLLLAGCGHREPSQQAQPPAGASRETPVPEASPVPPDTTRAPSQASKVGTTPPPEVPSPHSSQPEPDATKPPEPSSPNTSLPEPRATTHPEPPKPSEATPAPHVVDPGGMVEVKATKSGLSRIGSEKCKVCHRVQFESWSASAHARRAPPLDCESCHGAGSEYRVLSVMKDPQGARAAGLVLPDREFCVTCHRSGWSDDMLARAHAHKPAAGVH